MRLKLIENCMFAFDSGRSRVFMYSPADRLDIPLLLAADGETFTVEYPTAEDIERNFTIYPSLEALIKAVPEHGHLIGHAAKCNATWSVRFAALIARDETTLLELANAIGAYGEAAEPDPPQEPTRQVADLFGDVDEPEAALAESYARR